jgi:acetylglutamate kinase
MVVQPAGVTAHSPRLRDLLAADVTLLRMVGMQPVVVEDEAAAEGFAALVEGHGAAPASLPVATDDAAAAAVVADLLKGEKVPVLAAGAAPLQVAGEMAALLGAEKLVLMNDAGGLAVEQVHETVILSECDLATVGALTAAGRVTPDVQPQLAAVRRALEAGVASAHIIDGRVEHAFLLEVLTDAGCGTKIVAAGGLLGGAAGGV